MTMSKIEDKKFIKKKTIFFGQEVRAGLIQYNTRRLKHSTNKTSQGIEQWAVPLRSLMTSFLAGCGGLAFLRDRLAAMLRLEAASSGFGSSGSNMKLAPGPNSGSWWWRPFLLGSKKQAAAAWDLAFFMGGQKRELVVEGEGEEELELELALVTQRLAGWDIKEWRQEESIADGGNARKCGKKSSADNINTVKENLGNRRKLCKFGEL